MTLLTRASLLLQQRVERAGRGETGRDEAGRDEAGPDDTDKGGRAATLDSGDRRIRGMPDGEADEPRW
jgi:hypothetical protein